MAYEKTVWVDGTTKLNAEHLNHIEDGLEEVSNDVDEQMKKFDFKDTLINIQ